MKTLTTILFTAKIEVLGDIKAMPNIYFEKKI